MKPQGQDWFNCLRRHIAERRAEDPLPNRNDLTSEQELQCQIIGGNFIAWLDECGPALLLERSVLPNRVGWEKDPFIVFTSSAPGLVAAQEILEDGPDIIVYLYHQEFTDWLKGNADDKYRWHIHTWSFFAPLSAETEMPLDSETEMLLDPEAEKKAQRYPLASGESLRLHREGTMCGESFGRGGDHLWKWNGEELTLLEECFRQWVS